MADKRGPVLTRAETMTLMHDIVVLASAAVLDLPFTWTPVGERARPATFTNAGTTQEDATGIRNVPWSTPIAGYREVDGIRTGTLRDVN